MRVCKCDLHDGRLKRLHEVGVREWGVGSYKGLARLIASQIHNVLQPVRDEARLHKVEKNQERAIRQGKSVPWPRTPHDVLPYGVDASIAALAVWLEFSAPDCIWLGLFASIIELFRKEVVLPILVSPTLPGRFVGIAETPFRMLSMRGRLSPSDEQLFAEMKRVLVLYKMLANYFDRDESRILFRRANEQFAPEDPDRNLLSICRDALDVLPALAQLMPPNSEAVRDVEQCAQELVATGAIFHDHLDLAYDTNKYGGQIVSLSQELRRNLQGDPTSSAYEGFLRLWYSERCWSPGCGETFVGAGRAFAACSSCKRVTYCSKECLARA
ncbi:uncharacterized protein PHACADRAFT_248782 [Phanerochaete carnosa HHB-10118-sp]|uniref:MYND-type domain-containing protein n=1 Tax=Phanerochaete carnosa (strain HHB-10118-sp) TaxID=650164 RepID=K5WQZ6_PHACS|nr:uncharacterized protein PHACADRAFT_248782 [Phanerochaete carnosa HHB-10118-sp]EKM61880.1 hypothetical protein PHACADRAFT_248782 [Phanerochaete carnosa HHB-10118-sp]